MEFTTPNHSLHFCIIHDATMPSRYTTAMAEVCAFCIVNWKRNRYINHCPDHHHQQHQTLDLSSNIYIEFKPKYQDHSPPESSRSTRRPFFLWAQVYATPHYPYKSTNSLLVVSRSRTWVPILERKRLLAGLNYSMTCSILRVFQSLHTLTLLRTGHL